MEARTIQTRLLPSLLPAVLLEQIVRAPVRLNPPILLGCDEEINKCLAIELRQWGCDTGSINGPNTLNANRPSISVALYYELLAA